MSSSLAAQQVNRATLPKPTKKRLKKRVVPKPDGRYLVYYDPRK